MQFLDFSQRRILKSAPITVDLVALNPEIPVPAGKPGQQPKPAEPIKPPEPKPVEKPALKEPPVVEVKQAASKKPDIDKLVVKPPEQPKVKQSLKKKSIRTEKLIATAVKRIEMQSETERPKPLEDRIKELKQEVATQPGPPFDKAPEGRSGAFYAKGFSQIEVYQAEVSVRLKNNWVFSEELAGDTQGLETRLVIKILPDGTITDVWYEKRSGNTYLDESAQKTVMKSNPLPPLPEGYPYYHLVVGFTPSGLNP